MKMNRHISPAVRFLGVAAAFLVLSFASSCTREDPSGDDAAWLSADEFRFDLQEEDMGVLTRSVFDNVSGWSDSKKSNVTLAAYCGGILFAKQYYSSGITAMTLSLEKGRTYNVYAMVNMGDMTSSVPDNETGSGGITSLVYNIPSYNSGNNSVSQYGIPMAGVLENLSVTASTSGTQHVPVKRLLARVTLNLACSWTGAQIQSAKVYNLNRRLLPFGSSVAQSSSDILSGFQELTTASSPGSTLTAVMYVPENLQGTINGASTSANKRPDAGISAITNKQAVLSYMEVYVTGSSPLSGSVTYRSYLGSNATNNFDIVRNTKYVWNLTYQANGLQTDNWKIDSDISDDRRIILNGPFYLERSETLAWSSVVNSGTNQTNIALSDLSYSFTGSQASSIVTSTSGSNLSSGSISVRSNAPVGQTATLTVTPTSNPNNIITGTAISGQTSVNVIERIVEWMNYDASVYSSENKKVYIVDPGSSVTADVDFSYRWPATNGTQYFERGMNGSKWTYTTPSTGSGTSGTSSSYAAGSGNTRDRITYSVGSAVPYGDYAITLNRVSPQSGSDQAYLRVADSRYLRWVDQTTAMASNTNVDNYVYTSPNEVHVYLTRGSVYTLANATYNNSSQFNPFRFNFGDSGGEHRLGGVNVTVTNFVSYFDRNIATGFTWSSPTIGDSQSNLNLTVRSALSTNTYLFRLRFKNEEVGSGHEIVIYLHVTPQITRQLEVGWASHDGVLSNNNYQESPARGDVYNGTNTARLEARLYEYEDGVKTSRYTVVSSGVTWSVYSGSQFLSVNSSGVVTANAIGTGVIRASATVNGTAYNTNDTAREAQVNVVADQIVSYGNPTLSLSYNPNPVVVGGGTSTPTVTYTQPVTYASGNTGSVSGTVTSFNSWSGSAAGFTLNSSTGVVTAASNMGTETTTYGNPTLSLSYSGTPIAYTGGTASPTVTYTQQRTVSRASTNQRSITVTVNATVNGKSGSASATVTQQRDAGASASTTQLSGTVGDSSSSFNSWSGSATGFSINGSTGVVTAASNAGNNSTVYGNPVVTLSYNPSSFGASGGTAVPTVSYTQSVTQVRASTNVRSVNVTVNATVNGKTGSASSSVSQSGDQGSSTPMPDETSGGTVTYYMNSATGFTLNSSNGYITVAQNNGSSSRSTTAWANVTAHSKSGNSSNVTISQSAGNISNYLEILYSPSLSVTVGQTITLTARYHTVTNGNDTYTDVTNSATWSRASGSTSVSVTNSGTRGLVTCSGSPTTAQTATIQASYSGQTESVQVTFNPASVPTYRYRVRVVRASDPMATAGTTSSNRQQLELGYSMTLKAQLYRYTFINGVEQSGSETLVTESPSDFNWSSSNTSRATVSGLGVVGAVGVGDVNITASPRTSYDLIDGNGVYYITVVSGGGGLDPGYD